MSPAPIPRPLSKGDQALGKELRHLRDDLRTAANLADGAARLYDLAESVGVMGDGDRNTIRRHMAKAHHRMVQSTARITTTLIESAK